MRRAGPALLLALLSCAAPAPRPPGPPNIVLVVADDLGYGDLGCFGATDLRTPHLDALAREGLRLTDFTVAQAVCTASRAALMSGCYPNRVGLQGALNHLSRTGIHPDEELLPELLKERGYATGIFGKWHLGTLAEFGPLRNGFDEFLGIPYSNDNGPLHPIIRGIPSLPFMDGEKVVEFDPDQSTFTRRLTGRAVDFIGRHADRPFFVYLPHVMPHVPIFASAAFRGRSARGLYGDVVEELDASIGDLMAAVRRLGPARETIVIFISDNGPFLSYGGHAGSAGPLREGKLTAFEGGLRVPFIAWAPGRIPAGAVSGEPATGLDLLPTLVRLAGARLPSRPIDGVDLGPLLRGDPGARVPRRAFFGYAGEELQTVRSGDWKLHVEHEYLTPAGARRSDGKPSGFEDLRPEGLALSGIRGIASRHGYRVERIPRSLYDLRRDPGERHDVSAAHPDVVARLEALLEEARADLGDALSGRRGAGLRPAGRVE